MRGVDVGVFVLVLVGVFKLTRVFVLVGTVKFVGVLVGVSPGVTVE